MPVEKSMAPAVATFPFETTTKINLSANSVDNSVNNSRNLSIRRNDVQPAKQLSSNTVTFGKCDMPAFRQKWHWNALFIKTCKKWPRRYGTWTNGTHYGHLLPLTKGFHHVLWPWALVGSSVSTWYASSLQLLYPLGQRYRFFVGFYWQLILICGKSAHSIRDKNGNIQHCKKPGAKMAPQRNHFLVHRMVSFEALKWCHFLLSMSVFIRILKRIRSKHSLHMGRSTQSLISDECHHVVMPTIVSLVAF